MSSSTPFWQSRTYRACGKAADLAILSTRGIKGPVAALTGGPAFPLLRGGCRASAAASTLLAEEQAGRLARVTDDLLIVRAGRVMIAQYTYCISRVSARNIKQARIMADVNRLLMPRVPPNCLRGGVS
jgi:hypothetical protein